MMPFSEVIILAFLCVKPAKNAGFPQIRDKEIYL